ncbi:hypothetical protein MKX03_011556 [Papaver bracteatum]|nr:hypothetical protein MKX03_011556 [Papaver bracteatum]
MAETLKPLTSEAIALTEKKMDMTLDQIIKMSKKPTQRGGLKNHRLPNKNQRFGLGSLQGHGGRGNPMKVRQFMDSRSSLRQGALAQRRSSFQGNNHFPLAAEVAKKAGVAPARNVRPFNRTRLGNWNKQRTGAPQSIQRTAEVGFVNKQHQGQFQFQARMVAQPRQKGTLDSLFANMKEQRMRMQSHQNNTAGRRGGFGRRYPQQQQRSGRGRNYYAN